MSSVSGTVGRLLRVCGYAGEIAQLWGVRSSDVYGRALRLEPVCRPYEAVKCPAEGGWELWM